LTKRHAAFTFESVHVRSLKIYEYFVVAIRGSAPNRPMGMFLIWAPLISVPYVTYAKEVRHVFCAPAMPKSSEHILTST